MGTKVYIGGLQPGIDERSLEDEFRRYGKIAKFWVARKPPGFAFIDFEDPRDAEDAVRALNGHQGWKVEISRSRGPAPRGGDMGRGGGGGRDMACYNCGEVGHMARDCRKGGGGGGYGGGGGGGRYDDRDRRGYSPPRGGRSRSRSPVRGGGRSPPRGGGRSRSPPRRRSPSPPPRGRSRSPPPRSRERSRSR